MKRSEMVRQIAIGLHLCNGTVTDKPSNYWLKYAESALNTVELCGMLPPEIQEEVADNESGCLFEGSYYVSVNKWDEE